MSDEQPQKSTRTPPKRCYRVHSIYYHMPSMSRAESPIKRRVFPEVSLPNAESAHSRPGRHIAVTGRFFVGVLDGISTLPVR